MLLNKSISDCSETLGRVKEVADQIIQVLIVTGESLVFAVHITRELNVDYNSLNHLFLSERGVTLEIFFKMRVIEKVKELLVYTEQSFKQIASVLGYNNVSTLSKLLKVYTGYTSRYFKQIRKKKLDIIRRQNAGQSES